MPISENYQSRRTTSDDGPNAAYQRIYDISEAPDSADAFALLYAVLPTSVIIQGRVIPLSNAEVEPVDGHGRWKGYGNYSAPEDSDNDKEQQPGEIRSSLQISGSQRHITDSLDLIDSKSVLPGGAPQDHLPAIGVTADGRVNGVDVLRPTTTFTEQHIVPVVNAAWAKTAADYVGTVNTAAFRDFDPGEVLFAGINAQGRNQGDFLVQYYFNVSRNEVNLQVGPLALNWIFASVKGWEYIWIEYRRREAGSRVRLEPINAYQEQVYEEKNWSAWIGT